MLVVGLVGTAVVWRTANRDADARRDAVADTITEAARATAANAVAGLGGAAGLVSRDGEVGRTSFEAFRADLSEVSSLDTIAYVPVVEGSEREQFETEAGRISDVSEAGFVRAPDRDVYWPVEVISPSGELAAALVGVDMAAFPLSAEVARRARDTGGNAITEGISLGDFTIFFIIKALYRPDAEIDRAEEPSIDERRAAHVGFVVSVYDSESLAASVRPELPDGVNFAITDDELVLAQSEPAPSGGVVREIDIGGRTWTVRVEDERPPDRSLALLLLGITALIVGGLVYLIRRSERDERDSEATAALIGRTADLAQHLAGAATVEEVATVIGRHVPPIFGARAAVLAVVGADRSSVRVLDGPAVDLTAAGADIGLAVSSPLTDAVPAADVVLSPGHEWTFDTASVAVLPEVAAAVRSAAGLALEDAAGTVVATMAVLWTSRNRFDELTVGALRTVSQLCEQTLQRAETTDRATGRAARLADLAKGLAGVTSVEDAATAITRLARQPVAARAASVGMIDRAAGVLRVHHGETVALAVSERYASPSLDERLAFTDAARSGRPVLVPDFDSYLERYPDADPSQSELGQGARAAFPLLDNELVIGAIVFSWNGPQRFDDAFVSTLSTIAEMAALTIQRARLAEHQADEARHSRDLAELAQGLASRSHTEDVTGFLASSVLTPLDAVHAAVGLVRDGMLHRHFSDALPSSAMVDPTPLDQSTPLTDAARTGEDVLVGSIAELAASYPDVAPSWEAVGFGATANLALRDRHGDVIGALGVAWAHPVTFDKELRDRLSTIVGIAAQTLERARLADLLRESADRKERLADLARHLSRGRTIEDLLSVVAQHGAAPVEGAIAANVGLVDEGTRTIRLVPHPVFDESAEQDIADPELDADHPAAEAVRMQQPVLLGSPDEIAARYPANIAAAIDRAGLAATAHLPLTAADGTSLGSIGFGWPTPQAFSAATFAMMRTMAELCTQTLERTRLSESEHRLVSNLQHRVVTPLPPAQGLSIAQRYRPAARQVGMGGDWYEGIPLDEHRYALVVGDIAGHGITAVADMIQLRAMIESLIRAGVPLDEVFPRASALVIGHRNSVTASACLTVIDTARSTLSYLLAGHPPPLVRGGEGQVRMLDGGRQPLLGIPMAPIEPVTVPFGPGSVLVAYTDGLIERRHEMIDTSIDRLRRSLGSSRETDPERLADQVMIECLDGLDPDDDVALVVIGRD